MTILKSQQVSVRLVATRLAPQPAVIDLLDGNRFVLSLVDPNTGAPVQTVIDSPVAGLRVRGRMASLSVTANGVSAMIEFSSGSRTAMMFGGIGVIVGMQLAATSGIGEWVAALRAGGADVRFMSWQRTLQISIALVVVLVAVCVAVAVNSR